MSLRPRRKLRGPIFADFGTTQVSGLQVGTPWVDGQAQGGTMGISEE